MTPMERAEKMAAALKALGDLGVAHVTLRLGGGADVQELTTCLCFQTGLMVYANEGPFRQPELAVDLQR